MRESTALQTQKTASTQIQVGGDKNQFCTFWVGGRLFGVNILDVREINREVEFSPIYHAPATMRGYVNIRGKIHLVIDLRILLGFPAKEVDSESRVVIFKPTVKEDFGVLVDKLGDIVTVTPDQIETREHDDGKSHERHHRLIMGECKLKDSLMILLDPRSFI